MRVHIEQQGGNLELSLTPNLDEGPCNSVVSPRYVLVSLVLGLSKAALNSSMNEGIHVEEGGVEL